MSEFTKFQHDKHPISLVRTENHQAYNCETSIVSLLSDYAMRHCLQSKHKLLTTETKPFFLRLFFLLHYSVRYNPIQ
jgi:hypothetical protein